MQLLTCCPAANQINKYLLAAELGLVGATENDEIHFLR